MKQGNERCGMRNARIFILSLFVICHFSFVITAPAVAVPQVINYQGVLRNAANALQTGNFSMTFKIYDDATAGTALYDSGAKTIFVSSGIYNVTFEATPTVFNGGDRWLEVTVQSDVMAPRMKINSVAYAITTGNATQLSGYSAGVSGVSIVPTTDASGKLSASVIPATVTATLAANSTLLAGYAPAATGNSIVPTTDATGKLSNSILKTGSGNGLDADTVDTIHANATETASNLYPLDSSKNFVLSHATSGAIIKATNTTGIGVQGIATSGVGVSAESGTGTAVYAKSTSGTAVTAESTSGVALDIRGKLRATTGTGYCVGTDTIAAGDISVDVANTAVTSSSLIFLTGGPKTFPGGGLFIWSRTATTGFTASMEAPAPNGGYPFSYLIIN